MNKGFLVGNVVATPELKQNPSSGLAYTKLRMAVNSSKDTLFVDVFFSGRQAEIICQYLTTGRSVLVEYRLGNNEYEKDGVKYRSLDLYGLNFEFLNSGKGKEDERSSTESGTEEN